MYLLRFDEIKRLTKNKCFQLTLLVLDSWAHLVGYFLSEEAGPQGQIYETKCSSMTLISELGTQLKCQSQQTYLCRSIHLVCAIRINVNAEFSTATLQSFVFHLSLHSQRIKHADETVFVLSFHQLGIGVVLER